MLPATELRPHRLEVPLTFTQRDFDRFADLSGDHNPIHVDPRYAARTAFGATVAHGMLLYSRLRGLIERTYPGCPLQTQDLVFPAPSYADEALTLALDGTWDDGAITLRMQARKPDGRLGLDGTARIAGTPAPLPVAKPLPGPTDTQDMRAAAGLPSFQRLRVGDTARITRHYSTADLEAWVALVQQNTPLPTTVPEPLIAALFSCLLGEKVPGHGTNYLKQSMAFHATAHPSEPLEASVAITRLRPDKALVNLATHCKGEGGRPLCSGQALVLFKC